MASFMEEFQAKMNEGLNFLKGKITDPTSGLEKRTSDLEATVNSTDSGLVDRVKKLESKAAQLPSIIGTGAASSDTGPLQVQVNDLTNRLTENEFKTKILLDWADTMYKDHLSLQREVQFNTSRHHSSEVVVGGIVEYKKQDNRRAAMKFFNQKMGVVATDNEVLSARRVGRCRTIEVEETSPEGAIYKRQVTCPRHMVVRCSPSFKNYHNESQKSSGRPN